MAVCAMADGGVGTTGWGAGRVGYREGMVVRDVVDDDLAMFGAFRQWAFVKIRKEQPYHAWKVTRAMWKRGR